MKASVALCTHNGAAYLDEQLESIARQTRPPDELIVFDDASSDRSADIAEEFALSASFPVKVIRGVSNVGIVANFQRAINACSGDIIFLADQDDVWREDKVERMISAFGSEPDARLVFTNAAVADESLRPAGRRLWDTTFPRHLRRRFFRDGALRLFLSENIVTGATLAFRADLRPDILPIPNLPGQLHDGWIAVVAAARANVVCLDEDLIVYRQHATQAVGAGEDPRRNSVRERHARHAKDRQAAFDRLDAIEKIFKERGLLNDETGQAFAFARRSVADQIVHYQSRAKLPRSRVARFPRILWELVSGRYRRCSRGTASAAADLLLK